MRFPQLFLTTATVALLACADRGTVPTDPAMPASTSAPTSPTAPSARAQESGPREALARQVAMGLANPAARALLKAQLDQSPIREHKLHFQHLISGPDSRLLRAVSAGAGTASTDLQRQAEAVRPLELYFPVPAHRAAWSGGEDLLVATEANDGDIPVAFDIRGRRQLLDPRTPPGTPVLALVPVETDFSAAVTTSALNACTDCTGAGSSTAITGGATGTVSALTNQTPGLYVTRAEYVESFEGWLKGDPEFDIHVLGKAPGKDSLQVISCAGRESAGPYNYTQRSLTWSGKALLYTNAQLDVYKATYPGQGIRIIVDEDDDGPCVLKLDGDRVAQALAVIETQYPKLNGGIDKITNLTGLVRTWSSLSALTKIVRAVANVFLTNDDYVGNAVDRSVTGEAAPFGNWIVKGENNRTTGFLQLEMK